MTKPVDVYIPDTSALVDNPEALDRLLRPGNLVVLLHQVLDELGKLQTSRTKSEGVRAAARAATRKILAYRNGALIHHSAELFLRGDLALEALPATPSGGVLAWEPTLPVTSGNGNGHGDNRIIQAARRIQAMNNGNGRFRVVLISEDSNMLLRCDALGLDAEPLRFGKLDLNTPEEIFDGVTEIAVDRKVLEACRFPSSPSSSRSRSGTRGSCSPAATARCC
jgi:predicted ribonuclease YlaK